MIGLILTNIVLALFTFAFALFLVIRGNEGIHGLKLSCAALVCGALWFLFWPFFVYMVYRTVYAPTAGPEPEPIPEPEPEPIITPEPPVKKPRAPRKKKGQDDAPLRDEVS